MRTGLIISLALHAAVLLWALAEFPSARESARDDIPSLPVDVVSIEDYTRIKAGAREGEADKPAAAVEPAEKPAEAKKQAPVEPRRRVAAAPPPPPASEPAPAPAPAKPAEPAPAPAEAAEPKPASARAESAPPPPPPRRAPPAPPTAERRVSPTEAPATRTAQAPESPRARPPALGPEPPSRQRDFNPDRIAALLDRAPDMGPRQQAPQREPEPPAPPAQGEAAGQDRSLSMSEIDALRARISQCWIPPVGGFGAETVRVSLRLRLNPDGTLLRHPEVMNNQGSTFFQAAADSALRAVWQCQPYRLPSEKYALWRDMILHFDPREMFGG